MLLELHAVKVLCCQNRWRGHFRSRDKDGGHTIPSAMAENPLLYANLTVLSSVELELLAIEVLHDGNREFHVFAKNSGKYIYFPARCRPF